MTVDGWDGRGLPPVARQRIARAATDGVRTSLLPVSGLAGLEAAGFDIAGEVLGTTVMQIGWSGYGGCGWQPALGVRTTNSWGGVWTPGPIGVSRPSRWSGYEPYRKSIQRGWHTALDRMRQEAVALGADGVVGVKLTQDDLDGKREFMALGTAVRSRGRQRPAEPFMTDLPGQDVAKLLAAGFVPSGIVYAISVAVRHDDWYTTQQASYFSGNTEVSGYTELLTHVRAEARHEFAAGIAKHGGDGALMSGLTSRMWPIEVGENHRDHVAECIVIGNAIARFHTGRRPTTSSLTILPLRSLC